MVAKLLIKNSQYGKTHVYLLHRKYNTNKST